MMGAKQTWGGEDVHGYVRINVKSRMASEAVEEEVVREHGTAGLYFLRRGSDTWQAEPWDFANPGCFNSGRSFRCVYFLWMGGCSVTAGSYFYLKALTHTRQSVNECRNKLEKSLLGDVPPLFSCPHTWASP